jgi:hypothetical protein
MLILDALIWYLIACLIAYGISSVVDRGKPGDIVAGKK